jgi:hypothetical protein
MVRWIAAEDIESGNSSNKTVTISTPKTCNKSVARNLIADDSTDINIS